MSFFHYSNHVFFSSDMPSELCLNLDYGFGMSQNLIAASNSERKTGAMKCSATRYGGVLWLSTYHSKVFLLLQIVFE